MKTIPFDLKKAQAGAKVVTRNGNDILQYYYFPSASTYKIAAHVDGEEGVSTYTLKGERYRDCQCPWDLVLQVEPTIRQWELKEVPVGALFKQDDWTTPVVILGVDLMCGDINMPAILFHGGPRIYRNHYFLCDMITSKIPCRYSPDGGKTWLPCGVEE